MRILGIYKKGGPEALSIGSAPIPQPAREELRIRVYAAGVIPTELTWQPTWRTADAADRPFPIVPSHEFSGVVDAVGADVAAFAPGDEVFGMNDWFAQGACAEYCIAAPAAVAHLPVAIDRRIAASIPISALTAWQGLVERAAVRTGERVVVHGGAGAVGAYAVQIAVRLGASVIATASEHNINFVREMGASRVVDYHRERFETVAAEADVVFDAVGGETLDRSWNILKPGGRLVTIAASGERTREPRAQNAFFIVKPDARRLAALGALIASGELRAELGTVFSLEDGRRAYEHKPSRGKDVIDVSPPR